MGVASCVCGLLEARWDSDAEGAAERSRRSRERAGEGERERATREAGLRQRTMLRALRRAVGAANDAAGATTRGWDSERCCGRYDARLGGSDAEGAAGFDDEPGVCSRRWRECCRGAESERSAYDGGRARAAGSDADEPVLRWRRLAWPEASTADREVGGHTSREVDPKPMRGSRRGSRCKRCTSRVQAVHWQVPESTVSASMEHKTKSVCE